MVATKPSPLDTLEYIRSTSFAFTSVRSAAGRMSCEQPDAVNLELKSRFANLHRTPGSRNNCFGSRAVQLKSKRISGAPIHTNLDSSQLMFSVNMYLCFTASNMRNPPSGAPEAVVSQLSAHFNYGFAVFPSRHSDTD
ncbi:hypothetical protein AAHC03_05147 [Spirometra sp. Aus1]|nr:unnamed protein product [Spirometra erinaceieuropaei]